QYSYIEAAKAKGYSVLLFNDELDVHLASKLEQKNEKTRYVRVDSDTIDRLIVKEDAAKIDLTDEQKTAMTKIFSSQAPKTEKEDYIVSLSAMGADAQPIIITQNEFMRRMKEMSRLQGGMMGFYGDMPNSYTLVLNTDHKLIKDIVEKEGAELDSKVAPLNDEIAACKKQVDELKAKHKDLKEEEKPEVEKDIIRTQEARESELEKQKTELYSTFAASEPKIKQLIDLALLANGMLKGEALSEFVKRSVNLL
ncbi:MAG: molecular chaperone HtpG, partial [Paludibacteraceae bacterium]|nr:molecular chaperone HtpG [Paludibacteraceae bacterium]